MTTEAEAMQRRIDLFNEYAPWIIVTPSGDFLVGEHGHLETFESEELAREREEAVGWRGLVTRLRIEHDRD